mgnify:CR=1 FL=1
MIYLGYVYFNTSEKEPSGAAGVALTGMVSVAVDRRYIPLGSTLLAAVPVLDEKGVQETTNDWTETERAYTGDSSIPDILGSVSNSFSYKGTNCKWRKKNI